MKHRTHDRGRYYTYESNYSGYLEKKAKRLEQEEKQQSAHRKSMAAELEWVRQNPKGRQAKSKARIARFNELASYEHQKRNETQEIFLPVAERLGEPCEECGKPEANCECDPTPWCSFCGAMRRVDCHCGPIADNE